MSRAQFTEAMDLGAELAREVMAGNNANVLLPGEIGIANTTAASAVLAGLTGLDRAVCGRGAGLDAQGLARKAHVVTRALAANPPDPARPLDGLRALGGLEFAGLAGAMLAAAANRTPVLLDGFAVGRGRAGHHSASTRPPRRPVCRPPLGRTGARRGPDRTRPRGAARSAPARVDRPARR